MKYEKRMKTSGTPKHETPPPPPPSSVPPKVCVSRSSKCGMECRHTTLFSLSVELLDAATCESKVENTRSKRSAFEWISIPQFHNKMLRSLTLKNCLYLLLFIRFVSLERLVFKEIKKRSFFSKASMACFAIAALFNSNTLRSLLPDSNARHHF